MENTGNRLGASDLLAIYAPYINLFSLITFRVSRKRVDDAKCILVTRVCVSLSLAAFPYYCTDPDVSWGNGRECP